MARTEREPSNSPENSGLLRVDPAELMQGNPAALILNQDSYNRMKGHFAPKMFEPPQVVKVSTFSSEHGKVVRVFVVDGLTRTRFAAEHKGVVLPEAPEYKFETIAIKDVTDSVLQNPTIVRPEEREDGQEELSMLQYLRAVVPPTAKHVEIAPDRIAAHLVNGWDNMVGNDLSEKFSALAALNFLDDERVPTATETELRRYLSGQEIMVGNTPDEKVQLTQAVVDMASIIKESRLIYRQVARSAFALVSAASPVIGGDNEARKQIYGLLQNPEVDRKLTEAYPDKAKKAQQRVELGDLIATTFKNFADKQDRQSLASLQDSLRDPDLRIENVNAVFGADRPADAYSQIRAELTFKKLERYYLSHRSKDQLSPLEAALVGRIGRVRFLDEDKMQSLAQNISAGENSMKQAQSFLERLTTQRDQLIKLGVRPQTLEEATPFIQESVDKLFDAYSLQQIAQATTELHTKVSEMEARFSRQMATKRIGTMVDQVLSTELKTPRGSMVRRGAIVYIFREVDIEDTAAVMQRLNNLKSLDSDLQSQVLNGDIRISHALRLQQGRKSPQIPVTPPIPVSSTSVETSVPIEVPSQVQPSQPVAASVEIPAATDPGLSEEEKAALDRNAAEVRRVDINNHRFVSAVSHMRDALRDVDLGREEMNSATKFELDQLIREIGRFRFGHPDMVRVMEDYDRVQAELTRLNTALLTRQEADNSQDTRTGR